MLIGFDASRAFVSDATGTENYSYNLLIALAKVDRKNRYRVYLRGLQTTDYRLRTIKWPSNFEFKTIRPSRLWTQIGLAIETWREPVDILFVPAHTLPILRNPKAKSVVTIHDLGVEYLPGYHQFPQRYYLDFASKYASGHADALIAVSKATKRDLVKRYGVDGKKVFVVHEGVDRRIFKPQSRSKVESAKKKYKIRGDYILFVGTIQPRKNLATLIGAFSKLVDRLQTTGYRLGSSAADGRRWTVDLVIAGKPGWNYDEILAAPGKLGIEDRVKFLGRVSDSDLPALYSGAVVFAFPSLFEGFGLPVLEALSCDCPVLASDIPVHREILRKIEAGTKNHELGGRKNRNSSLMNHNSTNFVPMILVNPKDLDGWVRFLYQTITKYEKRSTFSNIILNYEAKFSWIVSAKQTIAVFQRVLG